MEILIADTAWLSQDRLATILDMLKSEIEVFRSSDLVGLNRILGNHPDIALVFADDVLVAEDGEQFFSLIRGIAPAAQLVLWTNNTNRDFYMRAIYFGAVGILPKSSSEEYITTTLQILLRGQCAFPRDVIAAGPVDRTETIEKRSEEEKLTPREREILDAIGRGQTVARIAEALSISPHTTRVHVTRIMKKLDLRDRSSLMYYAIKSPRRRTMF